MSSKDLAEQQSRVGEFVQLCAELEEWKDAGAPSIAVADAIVAVINRRIAHEIDKLKRELERDGEGAQ